MQAVSIVTHLMRALRQALGRVALWFTLSALVSALAVEVVGYLGAGQHFPPSELTNIAALALAVAVGYAAALTVLIGEVVRFMVSAVQDAERNLVRDVAGGKQVVESLVSSFENIEHQR